MHFMLLTRCSPDAYNLFANTEYIFPNKLISKSVTLPILNESVIR